MSPAMVPPSSGPTSNSQRCREKVCGGQGSVGRQACGGQACCGQRRVGGQRVARAARSVRAPCGANLGCVWGVVQSGPESRPRLGPKQNFTRCRHEVQIRTQGKCPVHLRHGIRTVSGPVPPSGPKPMCFTSLIRWSPKLVEGTFEMLPRRDARIWTGGEASLATHAARRDRRQAARRGLHHSPPPPMSCRPCFGVFVDCA